MKRVLLIGLILAVLLAACGGSATSLTGTTWTVTSLQGVGVDPTVKITAIFGTDGNDQRLGRLQQLHRGVHDQRQQSDGAISRLDHDGLL